MTRKEIIKTVVVALLEVAVGVAVYLALKGLYGKHTRTQPKQVDTTTVYDTIAYYIPVPVDSLVVRYDMVRLLSVRDTITHTEIAYDTIVRDSVNVVVPITQKRYETEDYRAYVSGYQPSLDSLFITKPTQIVRITEKPSRWGIGISAGYGIGTKGLSPYIGVGVVYRIWDIGKRKQ